jgi:putative transposase
MDELAGLTEEARKRAMERYRLLQPHLEHNEALITVAKAASLPYRTAHRLVSQCRRFGLVALVVTRQKKDIPNHS